MDELIAFVRRCLDDDERDAKAQQDFEAWVESQRDPTHVDAIVIPPLSQLGSPGDPARVLAEVNAKRRILDRIESLLRTPGLPDSAAATRWGILMNEYELRILPALAQPYAGRDGWRPEWALDQHS